MDIADLGGMRQKNQLMQPTNGGMLASRRMRNIANLGVSTYPFTGLAMIRCLATLLQLVRGLVRQISNLLLGNNLLLMRSLCVHLQGNLEENVAVIVTRNSEKKICFLIYMLVKKKVAVAPKEKKICFLIHMLVKKKEVVAPKEKILELKSFETV